MSGGGECRCGDDVKARSRCRCGALVVVMPVSVGEVPVLCDGDFGDGGAGRLARRRAPVHRLRQPRREEGQLADLELHGIGGGRGARTGVRCAEDTGLRNFCHLKGFAQNQLWCEIVSLSGPAAENPSACDLRLFSVAGRLARGGRRLRLRLAERWPWAGEITAAITRLQATLRPVPA